MSRTTDFENVDHNDSTFAFGFCQNFNNATGNRLSGLNKLKGIKVNTHNNIHLTLNGDAAKTHDPTKHSSPELAIANRQAIHCDPIPSEEFTAFAPCVWSHGMYFRLSIFWFVSRLSGSNPKEPKYCKQTGLHIVQIKTYHWQAFHFWSNLDELEVSGDHAWSGGQKALVSSIPHRVPATNPLWDDVSVLLDQPIEGLCLDLGQGGLSR